MDPDANLAEQRELIAKYARGEFTEGDTDRLVELAAALDNWLFNGGFIPKDWRPF
jgi:hypothetical protein